MTACPAINIGPPNSVDQNIIYPPWWVFASIQLPFDSASTQHGPASHLVRGNLMGGYDDWCCRLVKLTWHDVHLHVLISPLIWMDLWEYLINRRSWFWNLRTFRLCLKVPLWRAGSICMDFTLNIKREDRYFSLVRMKPISSRRAELSWCFNLSHPKYLNDIISWPGNIQMTWTQTVDVIMKRCWCSCAASAPTCLVAAIQQAWTVPRSLTHELCEPQTLIVPLFELFCWLAD